MKIGLAIHSTDLSMSPIELAKEAEERGFYSLYLPEHTHIPTSRRTPPPTGEEVLAEEYKRSLDPCVALAAAAAVTSKIRLGTGVALVAQHDTITFAKELASLDFLSGGRLVLGIGYGWNREEMENHGIDVKHRRALVREKMLAMQELWSREVAEFHGEFVSFEASWLWPKPVQQPRPRVLIGGAPGPKLFAHTLLDLRRALEQRGRDPGALHVAPLGILPDRAKLDYYESIGVTEAILRLPSKPRDAVMTVLDEFTKHVRQESA
jgi:probable F420-dependent oxidoreductase